jgi:hypothetical protein
VDDHRDVSRGSLIVPTADTESLAPRDYPPSPLAAGAIVERQDEDTWLVTIGPRGRTEVSIGGTLIIRPSADAGQRVFDQAFLVSVASVRGRR